MSNPTPNQLSTSRVAGVPAGPEWGEGPAVPEVERLRAEVARLQEENRAFLLSMRHMTAAAAEVLEEARREAAETRERAAAEAYERLTVARADSRALVHEERYRAAAELELLAAVRERVEEERASLNDFHRHLSGRLRDLMRAMVVYADRTPMIDATPPPTLGAIIDTVGQEERRAVQAERPHDPIGAHDAELEAAFAAFFGGDDPEPSRRWILSD